MLPFCRVAVAADAEAAPACHPPRRTTPPRCCERACVAMRLVLSSLWRPTMSSWPARWAGVMAAASRSPQDSTGVAVVVVGGVVVDGLVMDDELGVGEVAVVLVGAVVDEVRLEREPSGPAVHAAGRATASTSAPTPRRLRVVQERSVTGGTYLPGRQRRNSRSTLPANPTSDRSTPATQVAELMPDEHARPAPALALDLPGPLVHEVRASQTERHERNYLGRGGALPWRWATFHVPSSRR